MIICIYEPVPTLTLPINCLQESLSYPLLRLSYLNQIQLAMLSKVTLLILLIVCTSAANELDATISCFRDYMNSLQDKMSPKLFQIFTNSYLNTLTTTVSKFDLTPGKQATYIITGDIEAMWLRDSTNQFLPYVRIPKQCPHVRTLAKGLINTQAEFIMTDPYTNAFKKFENPQKQRHFYLNDKTETLIFGIPVDLCRRKEYATKSIWQRKFEIDSLASFLRLAYEYADNYKTIDFVNIKFLKALRRIMTVIDQQTKDHAYERDSKRKFYTFYRDAKELADGQIKQSFSTGMIKTGFRPSDDPNDLAYNVPGNAMMCTYMKLVAEEVLDKLSVHSIFKSEANILSAQLKRSAASIRDSIFKYGVVNIRGKDLFAYEVSGSGESRVFDDANLPSLISLSYFKFVPSYDPIYQNTRQYILSPANPYYYQNNQIKGVGSSHTPIRNIWPLALITQILTTNNEVEIRNCLQSLSLHSKDNLMHESFSIDSPQVNTRPWFAWANSFFGEMIITLANSKPELLK